MLKAKYRTGSSLILDKPNDQDFVYFYETKEEKREALIKYRHEENIDVHFDYIRPLKVFLGCYIYPFMELVEGEEIEEIKNFNFLEHKDEYIALVRKYIEWLPRESKRWYHIYLGISFLDKGSMELTEEQRENAQSIHDNGINCELYNYIIDYLSKV